MTCATRGVGQGHIKLGLLILSRRTGCHFAGENAWGDTIDADFGLREGGGHHSRQVDEAWEEMSGCIEGVYDR